MTQAVRTLNRLLICDKISEISENWSWWGGTILGPWVFPNSGWGLVIHPPSLAPALVSISLSWTLPS